eukprot:scaffold67146_cov30-Tisochrysis_lutea.AAC.9
MLELAAPPRPVTSSSRTCGLVRKSRPGSFRARRSESSNAPRQTPCGALPPDADTAFEISPMNGAYICNHLNSGSISHSTWSNSSTAAAKTERPSHRARRMRLPQVGNTTGNQNSMHHAGEAEAMACVFTATPLKATRTDADGWSLPLTFEHSPSARKRDTTKKCTC